MKKLIVALLLVAAALSYGMEIKRHWLEPGVGFDYGMKDKNSMMEMTVPYVKHDFKATLNPMFTMYMLNDLSYKMTTYDFDGTAGKETQTNFDLNIAPGFEMNLPSDMYIYVEPSYNMANVANENSVKKDGVTTTTINMFGSFSYDLTTTRIHLLSPWDYYKDQYLVGVAYGTDLYSKTDISGAKAAEEHDGYFKVFGEYNYLNKDMNMMISPNVSFVKHLNEKISENAITDINVDFAKDINEQFNVFANVGMEMTSPKVGDAISIMSGEVMANYFPIVPLRIGAGVGFEKSNEKNNDKARIDLKIAVGYRLDFTK